MRRALGQALVMIMMSKTGLCCQGTLEDLFPVANRINKPILTHRWVLINFPLKITYVSFGDLVIQWRACGGIFRQSDRPAGDLPLGMSPEAYCLVYWLTCWRLPDG